MLEQMLALLQDLVDMFQMYTLTAEFISGPVLDLEIMKHYCYRNHLNNCR